MKLVREVEIPRHVMRAHQVVLAVIGCLAVALASQQCAGQVRSRLDAAIARDPLPSAAVEHSMHRLNARRR